MSEVLFVLGGGIGNVIQAMPTIKLVSKEKHSVDLFLQCLSAGDELDIFKTKFVNDVFNDKPQKIYDYQLNGHFLFNHHWKSLKIRHYAEKIIHSRIGFSRHSPEAKFYQDLAVQMGIDQSLPHPTINVGTKGYKPQKNTIAIYPGSKPNFSMKRWDKYDELAERFDNVILVGTENDIESHGKPSWIKQPWNWPKHVKKITGSLQEVAYTISKCKLFIGNDGGLAHIAAATGIPTYIIFGPSSIKKNKPYCNNAHPISLGLECSPCQYNGQGTFRPGRATCPYKLACMKDLSVDEVMKHIKL